MKRIKRKITLIVLLLLAATQLSFGQYFQGLYDYEGTINEGFKLIIQPSGNYYALGAMIKTTTTASNVALAFMHISTDGSTIISKYSFYIDSVNIFSGNNGEIKLIPGGYLSPFYEQITYGSFARSWAGIAKYDGEGDIVFTKTYTDTSVYYDLMNTCAVMPDGGYIGGGERGLNTPSNYPGYIIRTDSMGDTLWTHMYQKDTGQFVTISNIIPLNDGRIIVAATTTSNKDAGPPDHFLYYYNAPWYMLLDGMGNIIKDTVYNTGFQGGGFIYSDMNGGYITMGSFDSLFTTDPEDIQNFPSYIAHLDTNFRITWLTEFPYSNDTGHREKWLVRQLRDSSYVILGDKWGSHVPANVGWAAKVSKTGAIVWSRSYQCDSVTFCDLRDMQEGPNGSLVFIGTGYTTSLPKTKNQDLWLVGVDSNGCETAGCGPWVWPTGVAASPVLSKGEVIVYPNPTSGNFTINCPQEGAATIYNIQGQCVASYKIKVGITGLQLPAGISPGMYICKYIPREGNNVPTVVRLVYAP